jgi:hypothetical protein
MIPSISRGEACPCKQFESDPISASLNSSGAPIGLGLFSNDMDESELQDEKQYEQNI